MRWQFIQKTQKRTNFEISKTSINCEYKLELKWYKRIFFLFVFLQDIETFDLEDFKYNSVNMTAFRLVDLEEPKVAEVLKQMERFQPAIGHAILNKTGVIQVGGNFKLCSMQQKRLNSFSLLPDNKCSAAETKILEIKFTLRALRTILNVRRQV